MLFVEPVIQRQKGQCLGFISISKAEDISGKVSVRDIVSCISSNVMNTFIMLNLHHMADSKVMEPQ